MAAEPAVSEERVQAALLHGMLRDDTHFVRIILCHGIGSTRFLCVALCINVDLFLDGGRHEMYIENYYLQSRKE